MRLGSLFLIAASMAAQSTRGLPWDGTPNLPWRAAPAGERPGTPPPLAAPSTGSLRVRLDPDGTLKVMDAKGIILLRTGLPGRPQKLWRDGGHPLPGTSGTWNFPAQTPLRSGIAALPLGLPDFRPGLAGILWVLDDEERLLTVVHPATSRVVYLALPGGTGLDLEFRPDQLILHQGLGTAGAGRPRNYWFLPWLNLLPQFILLSTPAPAPKPGTALQPFPRE